MNSLDMLSASYRDINGVKYDYAVLPWGATEPHNYHLPYLTDCYLAHGIAKDTVKKTFDKSGVKGMILPPIPFGSQNPGQHTITFCIHTRYETQKAILTDIVASLHKQGMNKLLILNSHGGNSFKNMIRDLAFDYPQFLIAVTDWFKVVPQNDYFENAGGHADEMETSVLMHYQPHLVNLPVAGDGAYTPFNIRGLNDETAWAPRDWSMVSQDTGIGSPHKSTAQKGKEYAEAVTDKLSDLLVDLVTEKIYKSRLPPQGRD